MKSTKSDIPVEGAQKHLHAKKINLDSPFISHTKFNSKWIKNLYTRAKTIKFLEENIEINIHDLGFQNISLDMTPITQALKKKIDKFDFFHVHHMTPS